jgi:glycine oxidase ThiO
MSGVMSVVAEVLILGGGVMGLAIALELRSLGAKVCILCRDFEEAASHAAAGMLAPQAEGIPAGPMRDLCIRSRDLYPTWIPKIQSLSGQDAGYWQSGILAPSYFDVDNFAWDAELPDERRFVPTGWADRSAMLQIQPDLGNDVTGGEWFPDDAQVDNRKLARALWAAAIAVGVEIRSGVTVTGVKTAGSQVTGLETTVGLLQADHYIVATGAWSQDLLPIAVTPRKGQMMSLRVSGEMPLKTVLFGSEIYMVPRRDGRMIIGATVEDVGFRSGNTPDGLMKLLKAATRLFPGIAQESIEDFWYGYRPATPDELPILGESQYSNLTYATGHYRNGILLTPITGKIIADWVWNQTRDPLLHAFHWSRLSP